MRLKTILTVFTAFLVMITGFNNVNASIINYSIPFNRVNLFSDLWVYEGEWDTSMTSVWGTFLDESSDYLIFDLDNENNVTSPELLQLRLGVSTRVVFFDGTTTLQSSLVTLGAINTIDISELDKSKVTDIKFVIVTEATSMPTNQELAQVSANTSAWFSNEPWDIGDILPSDPPQEEPPPEEPPPEEPPPSDPPPSESILFDENGNRLFNDVELINAQADNWFVRLKAYLVTLDDILTVYIPPSHFYIDNRGGVLSEITFYDNMGAVIDSFDIDPSFNGGFIEIDLNNDVNLTSTPFDFVVILPLSFSTPQGGFQEYVENGSYFFFNVPILARFFYNQVLVKSETFNQFLPSPPNIAVPQGVDVVWLDSNGSLVNFDLIYNTDIDLFGSLDTALITYTFIVNDVEYDTRQFAFGQTIKQEALPDNPQLAGLFFHYWYIETRVADLRFNIVGTQALQNRTFIAQFGSEPLEPTQSTTPSAVESTTMTGISQVFTNLGLFDLAGLSFVFMIILIIINTVLVFYKFGISFIVIIDLMIMGLFTALGLLPMWAVFIFSSIGIVALILLNGRGVNYE